MRKINLSQSLAAAALIAPLLVGCSGDSGGPGSNVPIAANGLPDCPTGQGLTTTSTGVPTCADVPTASTLTVPSAPCGATQALTSNGTGILCTANSTGDTGNASTTVSTQDGLITMISGTLDTKRTTLIPKARKFLGLTSNTHGTPMVNGTDNALTGAAKFCRDEVTGAPADARMCSTEDIYQAMVNGSLAAGTDATKQIAAQAWIYAPSGDQVLGTATKYEGLGDNCGSNNYTTAHVSWSGKVLTTQTVGTGDAARFQLKVEKVGCNGTSFKIACCGTPAS